MATPEDRLTAEDDIGFTPPTPEQLTRRFGASQDRTAVIGQTTEPVKQGEPLREAFLFGEEGPPRPTPAEDEEDGDADESQLDLTPDELRDRLPESMQEKLGQFAEEDQERILTEMIGALQSEEIGGDQAIPAIEELETRLGRRGPSSAGPGTGEIEPIPEEQVGTGLEGFGDLLERGIQKVGGAVKDKAVELFEGVEGVIRGEDEEFTVEDFPGIALRGSMVGVDLVEEAGEMAVDGFMLADEAEDSVMRGLVQGFITQPIDAGADFVSASTGVETAEEEVTDRIEILLPEQSDNAFFRMTEEMVQLGAGFVGSGKVLNRLSKLTGGKRITDLRKLPGLLQRAGRAGVAEAVSVDPETPRLADWIGSMNIPAVSDGFAMLDPDADDSDAVARIKRGLEGVMLESTVEAMIGQWRVMHGLNRWIEAPGPAERAKALEQIEAGVDQFEKWRRPVSESVAPGQKVKVTRADDGVFEIRRARVEDFVPPGFTRDPKAFDVVEAETLDDVLEEGPDMVHVTTAKSAVQEEGLASRSEIGRSALGGGPSDKVSVAFDPQHAQRIQERLTLAVRAARGEAEMDEVIRHFENTFGASESPAPLAQSLSQRNPAFQSETAVSDWETFRNLVREEYGDDIGQLAIDLDFGADRAFRGLGGEPAEGSLQSVGILTDPELLAKIDPEEIGMVRVAAREGANPRRVPLESELRFDPQDVRVIQGGSGPAPGVTPDIPADQVVLRASTRGQAESVAASLDQLLKHGRPTNANRFGELTEEQADMVMQQTRAAVRRSQAEGTTVSEQVAASDFFNLKTLNSDESVAVIDAMARVMVDEMENARGSVTIEQMRDEAETILQGFGNDELASVLTDRMEDFQGMHAWVLAAHSFMGDQMDQIGRATMKLGQAPGDRALRGQIREKLVGLFQMTNMLNGAESEAGRTLRAIKELTDDPELGERLGAAADDVSERSGRTGPGDTPESVTTGIGEVTDQIEEVVKMEEGPGLLGQMGLTVDDLKSADADRKIRAAVMDADDETIDRMGAMISMSEHPREMLGASKAFRIIKQGGAGNKAFNFFMNNILSGLRTQATIASSAITMGNFQPISKIVGGQMLKALPGPRNEVGERLIRLGAEEMRGHQMYLQDGARMMGRALKAGHSFIGGRTTRRVAETTAGQAFTEWVPRWMGSVDEMIRQVRYRAIVRAQAMEHYRGQGLSGDELARKAEEIVDHSFNPETGEALFKGMLDEATVATFSNPLGESSLSKKFANMIQRSTLFRYLVPFTRAPSNLITKAWEISPPFSFGKKTIRQSMVNSQEEAGRILGENFIGSMIAGFALWGAQHGFITGGGPVDKGMRNTWEQNHDRYSFHFENEDGDIETISYRRFEPFTIPLSIIADVSEGFLFQGPGIESGRVGNGQIAVEAISRFAASALDRTYLTTLNDMILGTVGGQRWKLTQALSKTATGLTTPYSSFLRSVNPDQHYRDTQGFVDDWKANIPGLSETIPPRFNAFGEKILNAPTQKQGDMAQITDTFNPFRHRVREKSDIGEIMYKLRIGRAPKDPSLTVSAPNGSEVEYADLKDSGLKSNPDQPLPWVRFNEIIREGIPEEGLPPMKEAVRQALEDSDLNLEEHSGNDLFMGGPMASVIRPILTDYYRTAENIVRSEYPIIQQQYEAIQKAKANAMAGQDDPRELDAIIDSVQNAARAEGTDESGDLPDFFNLD